MKATDIAAQRDTSATGTDNTTTNSLWAFPNGLGHSLMADIVGFQVEAADGAIGHIDHATDELEAAAIVVDTGFWIFGKKRMIPAGVIDTIDAEARVVRVQMTKDDIKHAPDYVTEATERKAYDVHREDIGAYYQRWWG